jgi:cell division protein FtsB
MDYQEIRARVETERGTRWLQWGVVLGRFLFVVLLLTGVLVYFYPRREAQTALRRKVDVLIAERDALLRQRDMQVRKMDWIRKDVDYLEIAARDRLGLQKDGEYVIRFSDEAKASPE